MAGTLGPPKGSTQEKLTLPKDLRVDQQPFRINCRAARWLRTIAGLCSMSTLGQHSCWVTVNPQTRLQKTLVGGSKSLCQQPNSNRRLMKWTRSCCAWRELSWALLEILCICGPTSGEGNQFPAEFQQCGERGTILLIFLSVFQRHSLHKAGHLLLLPQSHRHRSYSV